MSIEAYSHAICTYTSRKKPKSEHDMRLLGAWFFIHVLTQAYEQFHTWFKLIRCVCVCVHMSVNGVAEPLIFFFKRC